MKRRLLNLVLALAMAVCVLPFAASAETDCSHIMIKKIPAVKATCTTKGSTAGSYCQMCGENIIVPEEIPALGHTKKIVPGYPATCTKEGRTNGEKCTVCNVTLKSQRVIKVIPHTVEEIAEIPATCVKAGVSAGKKCTVCKEVLEGLEEIAPTGSHEYVFDAKLKEPTCTKTGTNRYRCKNCSATSMRYPVALGHTPVDVAEVPATCVKAGTTAGKKCSVCEEILEGIEEIAPTGNHNYVNYEGIIEGEEPTCTEGGKGKYRCSTCTKWAKKPVPATGHKMEILDVYREPSCTKGGCTKSGCVNVGCGLTILEETEALGHTEVALAAVPATCTSTGLEAGVKCSTCEEVLSKQIVIPELPHSWKTYEEKAATCTEDGHNAYKECTVCLTTQNKEVYPAGHKYENFKCTVCQERDVNCEHKNRVMKYTAPTCTDAGSQSFWCPDCNYESMETLPQLAHTEEVKSIPGTCTTKGKTWTVCTVCGQTTKAEAETGYGSCNFVDGICSVCGASACDHPTSSRGAVVVRSATCTQDGCVEIRCNDCGKEIRTETIEAIGHNHVNGICANCGHKDSNRITNDFQDVYIVG